MIETLAVRWVITFCFLLAGVYSACCMVKPPRPVLRYCHAWHLLMCAAMIAMSWAWGMSLPALPQKVMFTGGALWFLWLGLSGGCCPEDDPQRIRTRLAMGYHALMMVAMVWMLWLMTPALSTHYHHHHEPMAEGAFPATICISWVLEAWCLLFLLAAGYYLVQCLAHLIKGMPRAMGEPMSQCLMAVGMLVMMGVMK